MSKNTCWNFFIKPWLFQQPPETKLFTSVASVRGQNLACYVSFNISYSLVLWVKIWQIFIPMRLELLKTHHCGVRYSLDFDLKICSGQVWLCYFENNFTQLCIKNRWSCFIRFFHMALMSWCYCEFKIAARNFGRKNVLKSDPTRIPICH